MQQDITCLFCAEAFDEKNEGVSTKCGHVFHRKCLNKWLITSSACPLCKKKVVMAENIKLNFKFAYTYSSDYRMIEKLEEQLKKLNAKIRVKDKKIQKLRMAVFVSQQRNFLKHLELKLLACKVALMRVSKPMVTYMRAETEKLSQEVKQLKQEKQHLKNENRVKNKRPPISVDFPLGKRQKGPKTATKASRNLFMNRSKSAEEAEREKDSVSEVGSAGQSRITRRMKKLKLSKE